MFGREPLWVGALGVCSRCTRRWMIPACRLSCGLCLRKGTRALVRILVTVSPRMYREAIALSIRSRRPDFEVLIAPPWPLDGRAEAFVPPVPGHGTGRG